METLSSETFSRQSENNNENKKLSVDVPTMKKPKVIIKWEMTALMSFGHLIAVYGLYLSLIGTFKWQSHITNLVIFFFTGMAVTCGTHRLWTHRSYKARLPLELFLAFFQTVAAQKSIYHWCRDHRTHHKYSETNADPQNINRGFFFAHIGWFLSVKHEDVITKGSGVYLTDLESSRIVMFQRKYYRRLMITCCFVLPTAIFHFLLGEELIPSIALNIARLILVINLSLLVNSITHQHGTRPYDKSIMPAENFIVSLLTGGEGWHNYHHVFPWDYKTSELGKFNISTLFIDLCAMLGLAYDLKTVPEKTVLERAARKGDGSRELPSSFTQSISESLVEPPPWGWGDINVSKEMIEVTKILNPSEKKSR